MGYLLPLIFIAEETAEAPQCERVVVCIGKAEGPYPAQSNDDIPQRCVPGQI